MMDVRTEDSDAISDLVQHLREAAEPHVLNIADYRAVAADLIESQEALIQELRDALKEEFGPAGPSRSTNLGRLFASLTPSPM